MPNRYADPTDDFVFKRLFGNKTHPEITIDFLNNILDRKEGYKIKSIRFCDPYIQKRNHEDSYNIFDICCTDESNNSYIVELQKAEQDFFKQRCQFYVASALYNQLEKRLYYKLMPVILVGIVNFHLFDHDRYLSHELLIDTQDYRCYLKHMEFHFIELPKFNKTEDQLVNDTDRWLFFFKNAKKFDNQSLKIAENNKAIEKAFEIVNEINWSKEELAAYHRSLDLQYQRTDEMNTAKRIGLSQGRNEASIEIAHNMLTKKISVEDIAQITGLSIDEVKKLKK